jgi:hypothetical protein
MLAKIKITSKILKDRRWATSGFYLNCLQVVKKTCKTIHVSHFAAVDYREICTYQVNRMDYSEYTTIPYISCPFTFDFLLSSLTGAQDELSDLLTLSCARGK